MRRRRFRLAEDKKPGQRNDLTAKIAKAYRNSPTSPAGGPPQEDDIQNPELDRAFEKMVQTYKTKRPEPGAPVVPFPRSSAVPMSDFDEEPGDGALECPECGTVIPVDNKFCGECGAARAEAMAVQRQRENDSEVAATSTESGIKHHHHYYHHHHYRNNPYLLLAIGMLLLFISWQQWREYQRVNAPSISAPVAPVRQVVASPSPAAEVQTEPQSTAAPTAAPKNSKPATRAAGRRTKGNPTPQQRLPELVPPVKVTPNPPRQ